MMTLTREPSGRRIDHRRRLVDATSDPGDNLVDDVQKVPVVLKGEAGLLQHAPAFNVDRVIGVHQNIADGVVLEQRLQGTEAEDLIDHLLGKPVALRAAERDSLLVDDLLDGEEELLLAAALLHLSQLVEIDALDEFLVDGGLDVLLDALSDRSHTVGGTVVGAGG
jgi:hypothetical protein